MKLSIIVPLLNEVTFVDNLVKSLNREDGVEKEIFLVDGGSTDGTITRLKELENIFPNVYYVSNVDRYVSQAFNKAFKLSKGEYLALLGAHTVYSENYFTDAVKELDAMNCDAVGGLLIQKGKSKKAKVIANCMSSKFGVGNTSVRVETNRTYVQSVAFGIYRREIFNRIGLFDEELIRNQDDEFHYRLNAAGFKMLLNPTITSTYYVRDSINRLYKQYHSYGYYKPLVFIKVPSGKRLRHFIPFAFVLYLLSLPLALMYPIWLAPLFIYLIISAYVSNRMDESIINKVYSVFVFACLHVAYGVGFLQGILKWGLINKR